MELDFHTLDVFTERRFAGNPLAVVHGADGLDATAMQTIAGEFNLSECVFVLKPDNPAHTAKIRIFTPTMELPFAGHPTVGTAILLAELRAGDAATDMDSIVVLEEKIGIVRIGVKLHRGKAAFAEFDAPKLPAEIGAAPDAALLAAALDLEPSETGFANHRPTSYSAGLAFTFLPVSSLAVVARAELRSHAWEKAFGSSRTGNLVIYCRETIASSSAFHMRVFAPGAGVIEDPATGSAAAAFAGVVHRFDGLRDGHHHQILEQGYEMGRPSQIALGMDVAQGRLTNVRIGGSAVRVTSGKLQVSAK
jgi:trans-2,3-dihydro-3-hydroxyanthranilate isomerase